MIASLTFLPLAEGDDKIRLHSGGCVKNQVSKRFRDQLSLEDVARIVELMDDPAAQDEVRHLCQKNHYFAEDCEEARSRCMTLGELLTERAVDANNFPEEEVPEFDASEPCDPELKEWLLKIGAACFEGKQRREARAKCR
jgi:hypothetical protein